MPARNDSAADRALHALGGGLDFRLYTFNAGKLRDRQVRDISDADLDWATRFNEEYVTTYSDPRSVVRFRNRNVLVAQLPDGVAANRIRLATEALRCCHLERAYRDQHQAADSVADGVWQQQELANAGEVGWADGVDPVRNLGEPESRLPQGTAVMLPALTEQDAHRLHVMITDAMGELNRLRDFVSDLVRRGKGRHHGDGAQ